MAKKKMKMEPADISAGTRLSEEELKEATERALNRYKGLVEYEEVLAEYIKSEEFKTHDKADQFDIIHMDIGLQVFLEAMGRRLIRRGLLEYKPMSNTNNNSEN